MADGTRSKGTYGMVQPAGVGGNEIALSFGDGQRRAQALPLLREEDGNPSAEEPVYLRMSSSRDPKVNHLADPLGIPLGVGEREGAAAAAPCQRSVGRSCCRQGPSAVHWRGVCCARSYADL
jgi:hypothetical protein